MVYFTAVETVIYNKIARMNEDSKGIEGAMLLNLIYFLKKVASLHFTLSVFVGL